VAVKNDLTQFLQSAMPQHAHYSLFTATQNCPVGALVSAQRHLASGLCAGPYSSHLLLVPESSTFPSFLASNPRKKNIQKSHRHYYPYCSAHAPAMLSVTRSSPHRPACILTNSQKKIKNLKKHLYDPVLPPTLSF